jgi:hypothetical protein
MTLSFPPFTRAVIWLLGINTAIFLLLSAFGAPPVQDWVELHLGLVPEPDDLPLLDLAGRHLQLYSLRVLALVWKHAGDLDVRLDL